MRALTVRFDQGDELRIEQTQTAKERMSGLLKKQLSDQCQGLWIAPCNSVHSFGMSYAIDLVYLNKQQQVTKVIHHFMPRRMSMSLRSHSIVELYSGAAKAFNIKPHMQMHVVEER